MEMNFASHAVSQKNLFEEFDSPRREEANYTRAVVKIPLE